MLRQRNLTNPTMENYGAPFLLFCVALAFCAPAAGAGELMLVRASASLPVALDNIRAVYDGHDAVYLVGGQGTGGLHENIVRYCLGTDTVEVLGPFVAKASGAATFYDGDVFYVDGSDSDFQIHRFSTASRNSSLVAALPFTFHLKAHAWDEEAKRLFLFGGLNGSWSVEIGRAHV